MQACQSLLAGKSYNAGLVRNRIQLFTKIMRNGKQIWVQVRGNDITDAGLIGEDDASPSQIRLYMATQLIWITS